MSVSDPLLKKLKGYVFQLRTDEHPIQDNHPSLQPFCETLEVILRKGLKQSTSVLSFKRKDYWDWIELIVQDNASQSRVNPNCCMCAQNAKSCKKVTNSIGRGRYFIRLALQKKVFSVPFDHLIKQPMLLQTWYDTETSILGDEILSEILMSLLFEVTEINFKLNLKNISFLEDTWLMPVYKQYELVPCKDLGIQVYHFGGRIMAAAIEPLGVAAEDNKVEPGDVLDELQGESLVNVGKGKIPKLLKQNQGFPVYISITKCKSSDGSLFPPISELLRKGGQSYETLQEVLDREEERKNTQDRLPPHAILPEDEEDEVPVHNSADKARYAVRFLSSMEIGTDGGVHRVEGVINSLLKELEPEENPSVMKDVYLELGEKDVVLINRENDEELYRHSYTGIASCGRRTDHMEYFCYIAGETTCTLAQEFVAYVLKARSEEESKTILMSIAQGFGRTHWLM